jgi:hypothetical protein
LSDATANWPQHKDSTKEKQLKMFKIAAVTAALLVASACSISTLTTSLNAVVVSADAALAVLGVSGTIPAPAVALASNYLTAVAQATSLTAAEIASADTDAMKASRIADIWAQAALPNLKDVPPAVSVALIAVDAAVKAFVGSIHPAPVGLAAHAARNHVTKVGFADKRALGSIAHRAQDLAKRSATLPLS